MDTETFTITIPAAVQVGDLMVIGYTNGSSSQTPKVPTGWTLLHTISSNGLFSYATFYKVAVSGDTGGATTVLCTTVNGFSQKHVGVLAAYSGATVPADVSSLTSQASSATGTSPSVTTTVANTTVVRISVGEGSTPTVTATPATERVKGTVASTLLCIGLSDAPQAAAGATGTAAFTANESLPWYHSVFALKAP